MPKDNEVDEKVTPVAWQWLDTSNFRKSIPSAAIKDHWNPLYSAATVAELRADRDCWREQAEDRLLEWDKACQRADAAEQRVADLESALRPLADATFAEFCSKKTERMEPDDSKVSYPEETCHITFGMIRNARKALAKVTP